MQHVKELGIGIIGFGFMGRLQSYCHTVIPWVYDPPPVRTRLVGVATTRQQTAEQALAHGYEFATDDWRALIARDDIDVIHVCTPNDMHAEQAIAALDAGKHVYCDKPLACTLEAARPIATAARKAAGKFQLVCQYRYLPATIRAKQFIDAGFLGRLLGFRAVYLHAGYVDESRPISWRLDKQRSGAGALGDLGSHILDLLLHLIGPFDQMLAALPTLIKTRPTANGGSAPVEVDDIAYMMLKTADGPLGAGAMGTVEASRLATGAQDELRFEIHGSQGAMRFNLMDPNWLEVYDMRDAEGAYGADRGFKRLECVQRYPKAKIPGPKFSVGWDRAHTECLAGFLRAIADDTPTSPNIDDAMAVQTMMHAAQQSAAAGAWTAIDPGEEIPESRSRRGLTHEH